MKGDWLTANLGSESFWRQPDYSAGRQASRQQARTTRSYSWSKTTNGAGKLDSEEEAPRAGTSPPYTPPRNSKLERSYAELGLTGVATSEEVKSAFRNLARTLHPDVSELPKEEAERKFKAMSEAYTFIKLTKGW
ncbi:MAG: J domain-containing protein [Anaerolineae bacterium]|nr:J domain-containing protein [Anaerolineae bacterium]